MMDSHNQVGFLFETLIQSEKTQDFCVTQFGIQCYEKFSAIQCGVNSPELENLEGSTFENSWDFANLIWDSKIGFLK